MNKKNNWEIKKLGEVCETFNGLWKGKKEPFINVAVIRNTNFTKDCKLDDTDIAFLDVELKQFNKRKLKHGDIIVEKSGGSKNQPVGRVVFFGKKEGNFSFSNFTSTIRIKDKTELNSNYLHKYLSFLYFSGYTERLQSNTTGIRNLDFNNYKKTPIPIPPLPIQEAIVKELDTLHRLKELQEQQLAEYNALAQATFYTMFGDPIDNEKGWEVKKLGEVCEIVSGKNQKKVENSKGVYPIMGSGGLMSYADEYLCPKGTVILGRKGTINKPFIVKEKVWIVDTAFGLVSNQLILDSLFLYYFSQAFDFMKLNVAVTIPSLRKIDIKEIKIPVPPLSLQTDFAERIEKIEAQKELVKQSIAETQTLIDYTMDKYFN